MFLRVAEWSVAIMVGLWLFGRFALPHLRTLYRRIKQWKH